MQKHESFRSLGLHLLHFPFLIRTSFDDLKNWVSRAFIILMQESRKRRDIATSRCWNIATLGLSLTFTIVDQTSQCCNVTTLERRDVGTSRRCCWVSTSSSSSSYFHKASENHHIHLQCTQDPKIIYRAIMHSLIYKIELKRSKDVDMT